MLLYKLSNTLGLTSLSLFGVLLFLSCIHAFHLSIMSISTDLPSLVYFLGIGVEMLQKHLPIGFGTLFTQGFALRKGPVLTSLKPSLRTGYNLILLQPNGGRAFIDLSISRSRSFVRGTGKYDSAIAAEEITIKYIQQL